MNKLTIAFSGLAMLLLAACNTNDTDSAATQAMQPQHNAAPAAEAAAVPDPHAGHDHGKGDFLALSSGEEVSVLSVAEFDEQIKDLGGLVAIEGRVKAAYPDHGALVLVDCSNMEDCSDGCCPQAEVPVRLAIENYSGELPQADAEVVVIGDLTVLEMGYELAVREIRGGDEVLVELKT